ncbi:MAG: gamma-glutamyltransferase [Parvibaculum sp.]
MATGSSLETKQQRDSYGLKKMAMTPSGSSFAGAVVADEPTAALIARNVLEKGGNAADAATALYFALSVTYPAAASLGGGGVCLVRDAKEKGEVSTIAFPVKEAQAGGAVGVPGNVRGFALIQARYGSKPWATLVSPAERLAVMGAQVSRATARQLADNALVIGSSPDLNQLFVRADGSTYHEADILKQVRLASVLGRIRASSVNGFYSGSFANQFVQQSAVNGGAIALSDLHQYRPDVSPAQSISADSLEVKLPSSDVAAGKFAARLWRDIDGATGAVSLKDTADKTAVALGARAGAALDGNYGSTSFVTVDAQGGAVACGLSMNGAFGVGHATTGSGIVLAATPKAVVKGRGSDYLVPVMVVRAKAGEGLYGAGAGAGAPKAAAAIEGSIAAALTGADGAMETALNASPADEASPVNIIFCPDGLPRGSCSLHPNPKGAGVGLSAAGAGN